MELPEMKNSIDEEKGSEDQDGSMSSRSLTLADGACWHIVPENQEASAFVAWVAEVMQLSIYNGDGRKILIRIQDGDETNREILYRSETLKALFTEALDDYPWEEECYPLKKDIPYHFCQYHDEILQTLQLIQFSNVIVFDAVTRGGMLLHGALIERDGLGIILAGPGGVGKTTACNRLPEPWQALSDDTTLIVRDGMGKYWAHPWPTWSQFLVEKVGGRWELGIGIELKAICFLKQSDDTDMVPLGKGEMVCLSVECIEQANRALSRELEEGNYRKLSHLHFRNVCKMADVVHGYRLCLDLKTHFWEFLDDALGVEVERVFDKR
jgi:SynChlorMet cassette protein ScmC